jgi:hypothetical protein
VLKKAQSSLLPQVRDPIRANPLIALGGARFLERPYRRLPVIADCKFRLSPRRSCIAGRKSGVGTGSQIREDRGFGIHRGSGGDGFDLGALLVVQLSLRRSNAPLPSCNSKVGSGSESFTPTFASDGPMARPKTFALLSEPPRMKPPMSTSSPDRTTPRVLMLASCESATKFKS